MKRTFALLAASLALAGAARAQGEAGYRMVVNYTDGTTEMYDVEQIESVRYARDTWSAYARGTYHYEGLFHGTEGGLVVYRSDANPTRFYIEGWGLGQEKVDFHYTYVEATGEVYVDLQDTGYTDSFGHGWQVEDVVSRNDGATIYGVSYYTDVDLPEVPGYWQDDPELPGNEVWVTGTPATPAHSFAFCLMYVPDNGGYSMDYEIFTLDELF